jgi:hypothetical protein
MGFYDLHISEHSEEREDEYYILIMSAKATFLSLVVRFRRVSVKQMVYTS